MENSPRFEGSLSDRDGRALVGCVVAAEVAGAGNVRADVESGLRCNETIDTSFDFRDLVADFWACLG